MYRPIILILLASMTAAMAQDQPPSNLATTGRGSQGGVARLILAHQLYAFGIANKDLLTVLNAARLATSVMPTNTDRPHETTGSPSAAIAPIPTSPAQMFDAAATLAAENDALLDLIDSSRREVPFTPVITVVSSKSNLAAAETDTWPVPFFGASLAEVAILGSGTGNLDLKITDENGNLICQDIGPSDTAYCSFYPAQNGTFLMMVINTGPAANAYLLLTN
jgi:hypothetical protein